MSTKVRNPKRVEVVNRDEHIAQFYIDGVHNVVFSAANCKIDLFQIVQGEGDAEHRRVVQTLVLPSVALVEFCNNVLTTFGNNREQMEYAYIQQREKFNINLPQSKASTSN